MTVFCCFFFFFFVFFLKIGVGILLTLSFYRTEKRPFETVYNQMRRFITVHFIKVYIVCLYHLGILFCFSTTLTFVFNFSLKLKFKDGQLHLIYSGLKELKEM